MKADLATLTQDHWDAIVIGAGPAGCTIASLLSQSGARVLIVDRCSFPRAKVCGGCVNSEAQTLIADTFGTKLLNSLGARALTSIQLEFGGRQVALPLSPTVSVTRALLDAALLDSAIRAGVVARTGSIAEILDFDAAFRLVRLRAGAESVIARASIVVCAAGLRAGGAIARPPSSKTRSRSRIGIGAVLQRAAAADNLLHMYVSRRGYVGIAQAEDGLTSIAAAVDPSLIRDAGSAGEAIRTLLPVDLQSILDDGPDMQWSGVPPLTQRRVVSDERLFLVGDAARYVEPITGEGIAWALRTSTHLAPIARSAIERWTPSHATQWRRRHAALIRRDALRCRILSRLLRRPALCGALLRLHHLGARWPALLERPLGNLVSTGTGART